MTEEDKELLLKDLCARLLYGVKCELSGDGAELVDVLQLGGLGQFMLGRIEVKPYLRSMASMTKEERLEYYRRCKSHHYRRTWKYGRNQYGELLYRKESTSYTAFCQTPEALDYLNSIHVDYRGMIKKGLALKAPKGMYEVQN